jgi:hypothetical protein
MKSTSFWDITPCSTLKLEDSSLQHTFCYVNTQLLDHTEIGCKSKALAKAKDFEPDQVRIFWGVGGGQNRSVAFTSGSSHVTDQPPRCSASPVICCVCMVY